MTHNYKRVLVTGGAGFIRSHIVDRIIEEDLDVTVIDNLDTGRIENRPNDIRHGYADISKAEKELGYTPQVSIQKSLTDLVDWHIKKRQKV